jgi:tetratricopeptide (TPR) repeat protein
LLAALVASLRGAARRRAADPAAQRARAAGRTCLRALQAGSEPLEALTQYVGDRLGVPAAAVIAPDLSQRLQAEGLETAVANEIAAAVERGTASRYGGGASLDATTVQDLVQRLERVRFGAAVRVLLLTLLAVSGAGNSLRAQAGTDLPAAIAAYRAGDYRAAEAAFAETFAATGDRRLLQARGNCYFRLGDLPRALWAYEAARLGRPRDAELLANVQLVRQRLQLDAGGEGFVAELVALRERLLPGERLLLCAFGMSFAALCLVLGWRRIGLRWIGVLVLVPTAVVALDLLWLTPQRPARAIALQKLALVSEPRTGLEPVATVRPGVMVELQGSAQGAFVRVTAGDRSGYAPSSAVAVVQ